MKPRKPLAALPEDRKEGFAQILVGDGKGGGEQLRAKALARVLEQFRGLREQIVVPGSEKLREQPPRDLRAGRARLVGSRFRRLCTLRRPVARATSDGIHPGEQEQPLLGGQRSLGQERLQAGIGGRRSCAPRTEQCSAQQRIGHSSPRSAWKVPSAATPSGKSRRPFHSPAMSTGCPPETASRSQLSKPASGSVAPR